MSLQIEIAFSVPKETARVAQAAFPKGNPYLKMRNELGTLFEDEQFADLFPTRGQPAEAPWRLALVTVLQSLQDVGTWLVELRDWLQTEYTRVGSPYDANEEGFTQWLAEVTTEIQRQNGRGE